MIIASSDCGRWRPVHRVFGHNTGSGSRWRRITLAAVGGLVVFCSAHAQNSSVPFTNPSRPTEEGAGVAAPPRPPTPFGASNGTEILRDRSSTGAACLSVSGLARPHFINKNLYDHVIMVENNCAQRIGLQVCYYQSQDCVQMQVPGGETKEAILGTLPMMRDFRFEFREKF